MLPSAEYTARQDRWRAQYALLQASFIRIGNMRLAIAIASAVLAWFIFGRDALSAWWLLVPLATFIALAVWHARVMRRRKFSERAIRFYDRGLARMNDKWAATGETGEAYRNPDHVYSEDLDLFGAGSLFELVSTARTTAGEQHLANWLLTPAPSDVALARQQAVRELSAKLDLREDIALLGDEIRAQVNAVELAGWGVAPLIKFPAFFRPVALLLAFIGLSALVLKFAETLPLWPLLAVLAVDFVLIFLTRHQVEQVTNAIEAAAHGLSLLSVMIARLETERFECPHLKKLHADLQTDGPPASRRIKSLQRWMELLDSSDHVLMRVLGPLLLWRPQLAAAIESWRRENGPRTGAWIHSLAEVEALSSLATLAFERPDWTFPEFASTGAALLEAKALRHPLLPTPLCVANDLALGDPLRLLIVSGSNMSGKSTLLRAAGLNTVLAWCGAPVAADHLRISPLRIGASIRVTDSLRDNRSRFFAEINRLRQIVDLTKSGHPVLFLLDELLSGTNSYDRRIGAAGIAGGLLKADSIGLLTTHDLALTKMVDELAVPCQNVHFEDRITGGNVEFDYRLQPGIVTHSNALELMRSIGLDI